MEISVANALSLSGNVLSCCAGETIILAVGSFSDIGVVVEEVSFNVAEDSSVSFESGRMKSPGTRGFSLCDSGDDGYDGGCWSLSSKLAVLLGSGVIEVTMAFEVDEETSIEVEVRA